MFSRHAGRIASSTLAVVMLAGAAGAQVTFIPLDALAGGSYSYAYAISADGSTVTGASGSSSGQRAFRWTSGGGMQSLGTITGFASSSTGTAISSDGSVVVGASMGAGNTGRAFRWTSALGMQSIGVLGTGSASVARGVSPDGSVVVGNSYAQGFNGATAFRWTSATGMQSLGASAGSSAAAATSSGSIIAGTDRVDGYAIPLRRTAIGEIQHLAIPSGSDSGEVFALSADGSIAVGHVGDELNGTFNHAIRWSGLPNSPQLLDLGVLGSSAYSYANATSADGSVVVGMSTLPAGDHAFLWTAAHGMIDLNSYLPSLGVNLTGWTLHAATGISADGTTLTGFGTFNGQARGFVVGGLPMACASCPADYNCSGDVEIQDIFDLLNGWFAGNPRADFNGADGIGVQDVFDFLNAWFTPC